MHVRGPYQVHESEAPLTVPVDPHLATEDRAVERHEFDAHVTERMRQEEVSFTADAPPRGRVLPVWPMMPSWPCQYSAAVVIHIQQGSIDVTSVQSASKQPCVDLPHIAHQVITPSCVFWCRRRESRGRISSASRKRRQLGSTARS